MSDKAVLEVIKNQTREYTALLHQHNTLLKVHKKTVDECALIESKRYEMRKDNVYLRKLIKQWEKENAILQESLDQCQRELLESKGSVQELLASMINEHDSFDFEGEELMDK